MARVDKKFYNFNPNGYMNHLAKNGIIIYPVIDGHNFRIEVDNGKTRKKGSKSYTTKTINQGLFEALKFTSNSIKDNEHKTTKEV